MALVDHDKAKVPGWRALVEIVRGALDRREDIFPVLGHVAIHVELAERAVPKHLPKRCERLLEDLATVSDEEETWLCPSSLTRAEVVERSDHRLAGAGRRDEEVSVSAVQRALGVETIEDLELKWERLQREERNNARGGLTLCA
jgi:hypothetical protein